MTTAKSYSIPLSGFEWELVQVGLRLASLQENKRKLYTKLSRKIDIELTKLLTPKQTRSRV